MDGRSETFSEQQKLIVQVRRIFFGLAIFGLVSLFIVWQVQNERMERVRATIIGSIMPVIEWGGKPLTYAADVGTFIGTHLSLAERIEELQKETAQLTVWRERARILEQENARLRDILNTSKNVTSFVVSAQVIADTNSQFRFSALLDVGSENGISDGWAVMDGNALAGRISGVARKTARVVLLIDPSSQVPVKIVGQNSRGITIGDGTGQPQLKFASAASLIPGNRVVTSGDGGVFPPDILIGNLVIGQDQIPRVRLQADVLKLDYVTLRQPDEREAPPAADGGIVSTSIQGPKEP